MTRSLSDADRCETDGCDKLATDIVYSRKVEKVLLCCTPHADIVMEEETPEYWDDCENCGCRLPVN